MIKAKRGSDRSVGPRAQLRVRRRCAQERAAGTVDGTPRVGRDFTGRAGTTARRVATALDARTMGCDHPSTDTERLELPMGALKPWHIAVLVVVLILLFGAKRLPDAARSLGRSLRIIKAETKSLVDDDHDLAEKADAQAGYQPLPPYAGQQPQPVRAAAAPRSRPAAAAAGRPAGRPGAARPRQLTEGPEHRGLRARASAARAPSSGPPTAR